ncbi:S8 family peptidase [Clostridium paraputrificum]|uniref:S8 family peptidase n=1 Tax=Clostridium paraputrificum TaxID=29363 RepID=UPI003D33E99A
MNEDDIPRLLKDVPSIIFIEVRGAYVLQDISPNSVDEINQMKINPYLNLTGKGVLVGLIDTGIDYLNKEFIREDGTSRIESIWDQTIQAPVHPYHLGKEFTSDEINRALKAKANNQNPYDIVPSVDTNGHGTKIAGIIGARGYDKAIEGVANDCNFVVVKLAPSSNYKKILKENGLQEVPVYNTPEVLAGIDYLYQYSIKVNKPLIVNISVGTTVGAHNANNLISTYLSEISDKRGIIIVAGTGNEGLGDGHYSNNIKFVGEEDIIELNITKDLKNFSLYIWITRPNRMSINITSPYSESSGYIDANISKKKVVNYILINTTLTVRISDADVTTGYETIKLSFKDIRKGIWKIGLKGDYIIDGRFHIWLLPLSLLPDGTRFLKPDPLNTLTIPSTALNVVTVAYYNSLTNSIVGTSGRGYNTDGAINPDITTAGVNILTTSPGGIIATASGSSAATAIVSGVCALIIQWAIIDNHDSEIFSAKVRSYLIYGADKDSNRTYPNETTGYGTLNILNTFEFIGGIYRNATSKYYEYESKSFLMRIEIDTYRICDKRIDLFD